MAASRSMIDQSLSRVLHERALALGVYSHPTGKGDGREDLLRELIADRVGTMFGVTKAEVVDSNGRSATEHDILIYDQSIASCLHIMGARRIVRVESLAATVEVKSDLDIAAFRQAEAAGEKLSALQRFYETTRALFLRGVVLDDVARCLKEDPSTAVQADAISALITDRSNWMYGPNDSVGACCPSEEIPAVMQFVFGYKGPSIKTAIEWLSGAKYVAGISVLGEYTIAKPRRELWQEREDGDDRPSLWGIKDLALGALLHVIEVDLERFRNSRFWFVPDGKKYYRPSIAELFAQGDYMRGSDVDGSD